MLKTGKLDSNLLKKIVFQQITYNSPQVLSRPGIGEDCAVVDFSPHECVMSTDPITAAVDQIGRLSIHVSCNDIASNGVEPLGILLAVLLPEGTSEDEIREIMRQASEAAAELNVDILGGHTEITSAVTKPVIVSTAIGKAPIGTSQKAEDMRPGDYILMTKYAGLEGTGIIAGDFSDRLSQVLTPEELTTAKNMLSMVSVVKEGVIAGKIGTAGMHDVTEGGVLGAVWEMCEVSKTGAELIKADIPVSDVTLKLCHHFGLDYLRLISSGSMIIVAKPESVERMMADIRGAGVSIACIGRVTERSDGIVLVENGTRIPVEPPEADEIYKVKP